VATATGRQIISDRDIWAAALLLVNRDDAGNQAVARAKAMALEGDDDGCVVWVQIATAIERLQATKPGEGEPVQ
jgi:hypothetical protein